MGAPTETPRGEGSEGEKSTNRADGGQPEPSQTASEFINSQLQLEADAREVLPYSFDTCTQPLGELRQTVFACLTCNPPPASAAQVYIPAGVCYSCSISCHGEHTLVELFSRRNFICDCGSTRIQSNSPCNLRSDPDTGVKGVRSQEAAPSNNYNQNFQNRFCGCGEEYDAHQEKGTMFQCLGLGTIETGGCGEDWWHPQCVLGLPRNWSASVDQLKDAYLGKKIRTEDAEDEDEENDSAPLPPGFPDEDDFDTFICYKCVESNSWIKPYANTPGFLAPVFKRGHSAASGNLSNRVEDSQTDGMASTQNGSKKRKASSDEDQLGASSTTKRQKDEEIPPHDLPAVASNSEPVQPPQKHDALPTPPTGTFSLFLKEDFRDHLCHCPSCYPNLIPHQQLLEAEDTYEPPLSEPGGAGSDAAAGSGARSQGTGSLLERGEAALSAMDRVRAIEGVMVYNHLKDKVKDFLKPYAESGRPVGAEDIKAYFEKLRGDDAAIREAGSRPIATTKSRRDDDDDQQDGQGGGSNGDTRREQSGY